MSPSVEPCPPLLRNGSTRFSGVSNVTGSCVTNKKSRRSIFDPYLFKATIKNDNIIEIAHKNYYLEVTGS